MVPIPDSVNFRPYPLSSPSLLSTAQVPGFMEAARRARALLVSAAQSGGLNTSRARIAAAFLHMTSPPLGERPVGPHSFRAAALQRQRQVERLAVAQDVQRDLVAGLVVEPQMGQELAGRHLPPPPPRGHGGGARPPPRPSRPPGGGGGGAPRPPPPR